MRLWLFSRRPEADGRAGAFGRAKSVMLADVTGSISRIAVALLVLGPEVSAQTWGKWSALGPFEHSRGAENIDEDTPLERSLARMHAGGIGPDLSATYPGKGGTKVAWKPIATPLEGFDVGPIHFAEALDPPAKSAAGWSDNAIAYLYRRIDADQAMEVKARCGSDDGMRLWLNGELLVDVAAPRPLNVSSNALVLRLEAGANHLLVKVANGGGAWAFQLGPQPSGAVDQPAINAAIDRGIDHLLQTQLLDGSWAENPEYRAGATGYVGYCLLQCDLAPDHPAVERARAYVLAHPSPYNYSTACELLFLCKLARPLDQEAIGERVDALLSFQIKGGLFSYPVHPEGHSHDDLSLTLYAALALRAVELWGREAPDETWTRMIEGTLSNFEGIQATEVARGNGAGFRYRPESAVTGSMTTAGISVLSLARDGLGGSIPARFRKQVEVAMSAGLRWLDGRMNWGENPGAGSGFQYFWLYGIERVGGLLGLAQLGGVDWYAQGAQYLIGAQQPAGSWGSTVQTILALLFLERASAPTTGQVAIPRDAWATTEEDAIVRIAARGGRKISVWVQEFAAETRTRLSWPNEAGGGLHVSRVEILATPARGGTPLVLGVVERDASRSTPENELAVQGELPSRGEWDVLARVLVSGPGGGSAEEELRSPPLRILVRDSLHAEQLDYADEGTRNLLAGLSFEIEASSLAGDQAATRCTDGQQGTAWMCSPTDGAPSLRIRASRAIKVRRIALSHGNPRLEAEKSARAARIRVILDEKEQFEVAMESDPLRKTILDFGAERRPRRIEIQVLEVVPGRLGSASVGFAEIELLGAN